MRRPFALPRPSRPAALATGAGLLVALSLPPWGFWPLAFVGIALFEISLGEHPTRGQRAARGWLFAAGWLFPGVVFLWFLSRTRLPGRRGAVRRLPRRWPRWWRPPVCGG